MSAELLYHLEVTLPRSGNVEEDIRRVGEAHRLLTSYSGRDTFCLLVPSGTSRVQIDFPNDTTKCNKLMIKQLEKMLGEHAVKVINKTPPDAREKYRQART